MTDIFSKSKRSDIMSRVHGTETKPEILVRKYLFSKGLRYRKNVKKMPGSPDVVLPKFKIVIFIHGCFWHGHLACRKATLPTSNVLYWKEKIAKNKERDKRNLSDLHNLGWKTIVIWECEISNKTSRQQKMAKLYSEIVGIDESTDNGI